MAEHQQQAVPSRQLFINGQWVAPVKGGRLPVINPATEQQIGSIPAGTAEDVDLAVKAACAAFERGDWSRVSGAERAKVLRNIAAKVTERKADLARLETLDNGKPIAEAEWDMDDVAGCFEYYAGLAEALDKKQNQPLELPMDTFKCKIREEPLGVVALITPWNYPMLMATWKVAPALAAGCCAILKPSEVASLTSLELGDIASEAGLPPGVLNIITGLGAEAGGPLSSHPQVDKVAFTGSLATGSRIMKAAADDVKSLTLELGGKSSFIIFDDVDIEKAVEWAMFGCFWTNGQICSATSRVLVQESIYDKFKQELKRQAEKIKISDPFEKDCRMGPVVNETQYKKVLDYVGSAKAEGCTLLTGGKKPEHLTRGYFLEPTVFTEVKPHHRLWNEEIFGPVMAVCAFRAEDEAIKTANTSDFGLAGAVMSQDDARCQRVAEALRCGIVWINCSQPCFSQAPWGGMKKSGFGRDLGEWGLKNYLSVKQITSYVSSDAWGWYTQSKL